MEPSQWLRRILDAGIIRFTTVLFLGAIVGGVVQFFITFFKPALNTVLGANVNLSIPDFLYLLLGTGLVLLISAVRGKPLLRDANREQLEAVEYVVRHLPEQEQRQAYRRIARKLVDEFKLDSSDTRDLRALAETAMREEKQP